MITIENVNIEDAAALLDIYAFYVKNTAISFEYDVPTLNEFQARIRTVSSKYPYLKAVDSNGTILGYAYATSFKQRRAYDWAVETSIYVRREYRGGGLGKRLYDSLEQSLKKMGIQNMNACIVYTSVADEHLDNTSRYFHEAMGFQLVGTFHKVGYKFGKWYDMIWMEKMIGTHENPPKEVEAFKQ